MTNANFYTYDPWQITKDSLVVTQHLATTAIFLALTYLANYQVPAPSPSTLGLEDPFTPSPQPTQSYT